MVAELQDCSGARIVIIDDDPVVIRTLSRIIAPLGDAKFALDGEEAFSLMQREAPELVLLDAELPGMSGVGLCRAMQRDPNLADTPVIFITRHSEPALQVECFEAGAVDFVQKPVQSRVLLARVQAHIRLKRLSDGLRHSASVDPLTEIANRRVFEERVDQECRRAQRGGQPLSLLLIDIDHFKAFNDSYGHRAGDECLRRFAASLRQIAARATDLVARYGGEEFAVLLPDTDMQGAVAVADRLLLLLHEQAMPHAGSPTARHVTASVGASTYQPSEASVAQRESSVELMCAAELVSSADRALYDAKRAGRYRVSTHPILGAYEFVERVARQ